MRHPPAHPYAPRRQTARPLRQAPGASFFTQEQRRSTGTGDPPRLGPDTGAPIRALAMSPAAMKESCPPAHSIPRPPRGASQARTPRTPCRTGRSSAAVRRSRCTGRPTVSWLCRCAWPGPGWKQCALIIRLRHHRQAIRTSVTEKAQVSSTSNANGTQDQGALRASWALRASSWHPHRRRPYGSGAVGCTARLSLAARSDPTAGRAHPTGSRIIASASADVSRA